MTRESGRIFPSCRLAKQAAVIRIDSESYFQQRAPLYLEHWSQVKPLPALSAILNLKPYY
jgi:hypothetical protein